MRSITINELEKEALEKEKTYKYIDNTFKCSTCNSDILAVTVIFSIHDGPFPLSGSGKTVRQQFPYCPNCESKPEFHGLPIKEKGIL